MNATPEQLIATFRSNAEVYFATNKFEDDESKFRQTCDALKATQFQIFQGMRHLGATQQYIGQKLDTDMNSIFAYLVTQQKLRIQGFLKATENLVKETVKTYEGEQRDLTHGGGMNEAGLRKIHNLQVNKIMEKFSRDNPFPQGHPKCRASLIMLKQGLENVLEKYVEEVKVKNPQESAKLQSLQYYNTEMKNILAGVTFISDEKLKVEHERLQLDAISRFEECLQNGMPLTVNADEMKSQIKAAISKSFVTFKSRNDQELQKAAGIAGKGVQICKEEYDRVMNRHFNNFTKELELETCHDREKAKLLRNLRQICSNWDTSFTQQFERMLEHGIEKKYEELRNALVRRTNEPARVAILLKHAKALYHVQMEKRFNSNEFIDANNLLDIHEKVKETVIRGCKGTMKLSRSQWEGVAKELDALLPGYMGKVYGRSPSTHVTPPPDPNTPTMVNLTPGAAPSQAPPPPPPLMSSSPQAPPPPPPLMSSSPQAPPPPPPPMSSSPQAPPPPPMTNHPPISPKPVVPPAPSVPPFPQQNPSSPPVTDLTQGDRAPPTARPPSPPVAAARSPTKTAPEDPFGAQVPVNELPQIPSVSGAMVGLSLIDQLKAGVSLRKVPPKDERPLPPRSNDLPGIMKSQIIKMQTGIRGNEDEDVSSEDEHKWD